MGAVGQRRGGEGPGAAAVGGGAAEQGGAVIDLDRGVGFRRAGQRQGIVIGDAVADRAAVGRERGDGRGNRRVRQRRHQQDRLLPDRDLTTDNIMDGTRQVFVLCERTGGVSRVAGGIPYNLRALTAFKEWHAVSRATDLAAAGPSWPLIARTQLVV